MSLSELELQTLANLAYLDCGKEESQSLSKEINAIIQFVEQLKTQNTRGIAPLFHPFDLHQRLREDVVTEQDCSAQLAAMAPLFEDGYYLVPKILDAGE